MDLTMVQRSCDMYLGVPYNDAQDSLLLHMVAKETGYKPRFFHHHFINTHVYLGVSPRVDFWQDSAGLMEFQRKFRDISHAEGYLDLRSWYVDKSGKEREGQERKDHIPFVLEQLSKTPRKLPVIETADVPLMQAIDMNPLSYVKVIGYEPHKWDSKAVMAA